MSTSFFCGSVTMAYVKVFWISPQAFFWSPLCWLMMSWLGNQMSSPPLAYATMILSQSLRLGQPQLQYRQERSSKNSLVMTKVKTSNEAIFLVEKVRSDAEVSGIVSLIAVINGKVRYLVADSNARITALASHVYEGTARRDRRSACTIT